MILSTLEDLAGYKVKKILGIVSGNTVRTRHFGQDIAAGLKTLVGGEIKGYSNLLTDSREEALERMAKNAEELGANAVLEIRFNTSQIMTGASEILVYGTACVVEKEI